MKNIESGIGGGFFLRSNQAQLNACSSVDEKFWQFKITMKDLFEGQRMKGEL